MSALIGIRLSAGLCEALRHFVPSSSGDEPRSWDNYRTELNDGPMPVVYKFRCGVLPSASAVYDVIPRRCRRGRDSNIDKMELLFREQVQGEAEEELRYWEHPTSQYAFFGEEAPSWLVRVQGQCMRAVLYTAPIGGSSEVGLRPDEEGEQFPVVVQLAGLTAEQTPNGSLRYEIPGPDEDGQTWPLFDHRRNGARLSQFALVEIVRNRGEFINLRKWEGPREAVRHMLTADGIISLDEE